MHVEADPIQNENTELKYGESDFEVVSHRFEEDQ